MRKILNIGLNTLHVPPITVSNPSESCGITEKMFEISEKSMISEIIVPIGVLPQAEEPPPEPRKEQRSVMREILAFVRKPSKKAATRTGKFAAAFTRAENSETPLMRQSTFSSSPRASSGAAKSAVTKQLSEAGIESKMSLKILNSKMSFRLRRTLERAREKKSSGDEITDMESSDSKVEKIGSSSSDMAFELENIRFEKVGDSYIKHEKIREEETIDESTPSPVQNVDTIERIATDNNTTKITTTTTTSSNNINNNVTITQDDGDAVTDELIKKETAIQDNHIRKGENTDSVDSIKEDGITINTNPTVTTSFTDEKVEILKSTLEHFVLKPEPIYAKALDKKNLGESMTDEQKTELQCPTFEIMPPSRRSSFDPPRSPYLENLRSPCETDPEMINLNRLDSAGDSFEMIDTDRNQSSFESRYPSSSHTSFDISRYQSTSCEDQTSSFEIIDLDNQKSFGSCGGGGGVGGGGVCGAGIGPDEKISGCIDLRKSSIELVDVDTFQKSGCHGRKSSLETHFDFETPNSRFSTPRAKKQISEPNGKPHYIQNFAMKSHYSTPHRTRSPLLSQTASMHNSPHQGLSFDLRLFKMEKSLIYFLYFQAQDRTMATNNVYIIPDQNGIHLHFNKHHHHRNVAHLLIQRNNIFQFLQRKQMIHRHVVLYAPIQDVHRYLNRVHQMYPHHI